MARLDPRSRLAAGRTLREQFPRLIVDLYIDSNRRRRLPPNYIVASDVDAGVLIGAVRIVLTAIPLILAIAPIIRLISTCVAWAVLPLVQYIRIGLIVAQCVVATILACRPAVVSRIPRKVTFCVRSTRLSTRTVRPAFLLRFSPNNHQRCTGAD